MSHSTYRGALWLMALGFAAAFAAVCVPPLLRNPDIVAAFAAGFVNPFAAGYALDAISCWLVLVVWIVHEAQTRNIRHGWIALVLGIVPGVATGFAVYLLMRGRQLEGTR